jgi:hypothetical protein
MLPAASATPPMQVSAMIASTGLPFGYLRFDEISLAAFFAIFIVWSSRDSLTPRILPSIAGRIPTLGYSPITV